MNELSVTYVDPLLLIPDPDNPNMGDMDALHSSIEVNGFFSPLLVQSGTNRIIAGHHRQAAAIERGIPEVPVIFLDVTDEQARRVALADNRVTRLGHDDAGLLLPMLESLLETDLGLQGTGFDEDVAAALSEELSTPLKLPVENPQQDLDRGLPYDVIPAVYEGVVTELTLMRKDGMAMELADLKAVRASLGLPTLSKEDVKAYEVGW